MARVPLSRKGKILVPAAVLAVLAIGLVLSVPPRVGAMDALRLFRLSGTAAFCGRVMAGDMVRITQGADRPVPASLGTSTCLPGVQETPKVPGKMLAGQDGDGLLTYSMVDLFGAEGKPDLVVLTPELNPKALAAVKAFLPGRDGGTWTVSPDGRLAVLAVPDPETEP